MLQLAAGLRAQSAFRKQDSWLISAAIVCVLAACAFLVGIAAIPVTDRDEPRFAQASRQMAESDKLADWVIPRVGEVIRLKKPPLIYWLQAPTVLLATGGDAKQDAIWMYRLPSALAALVAALATMWLGRRMFGGNTGLLAACLLVVSPVIVTDCHMARADEVLLAATTLAMCVLWTLWREHRINRDARGGLPFAQVVLFWFFVGVGVLAKGPITPFVAGTAALGCAAARRDWRFLWRLRPITGVVVLAALALPWLYLAMREVGWETLKAAFDKEIVQRAKEGAEGHAGPPGYYLVTLVAFFFPGSLITGLAFGRMVMRAFAVKAAEKGVGFFARMRTRFMSARGRDAEVFLFFWLVPTWLAFEMVVTKFPHYILPTYPAIALLTARCVLGGVRALPKTLGGADRFGFGAWLVIGAGFALGGPTIYFLFAARGLTAPAQGAWPTMADAGIITLVLASIATIASVVLLVKAWRAALAGAFATAMALAIPATALAEMANFGVWLPNTRWIWNTPRIVGLVAKDCGKTPVDADFPLIAGVGYQEDSLLWTTRNKLVRFGDEVTEKNRAVIEAWCGAHPGAYLLIPRANAAEFGSFGDIAGEVRGFNYSDGNHIVDHALIRLRRP